MESDSESWQHAGSNSGGEQAASSRATAAEQHEEIGKTTGAMKYVEMTSKLFDFKTIGKLPVLERHKAVDWP